MRTSTRLLSLTLVALATSACENSSTAPESLDPSGEYSLEVYAGENLPAVTTDRGHLLAGSLYLRETSYTRIFSVRNADGTISAVVEEGQITPLGDGFTLDPVWVEKPEYLGGPSTLCQVDPVGSRLSCTQAGAPQVYLRVT